MIAGVDASFAMPKKKRRGRGKTGRDRRPPQSARGLASDALARALADQDAIFAEVKREIVAALPERCRVDRVTGPVDAAELLTAARLTIETLGRRCSEAMGSYSWLFWLRRFPSDSFSGAIATSAPYRQSLAEVMSSWTTTPEHFEAEVLRTVVPATGRDQLDAVVRMCALASALAMIHGSIRRAGKGESVRWFKDDLPHAVRDFGLDEMITLYDERNLSRSGMHAGTQAFEFHPFLIGDVPEGQLGDLALIVSEIPEAADVPVWRGPLSSVKRWDAKPGKFVAGVMTTSDLREFLELSQGAPVWKDERLASLIIILRVLFIYLFVEGLGSEWNTLPMIGYLVFPTKILTELVHSYLRNTPADLAELMPGYVPASADTVIAGVSAIETSAWPLMRGPILRVAGDQTAVDVHAATYRLGEMLTIPIAGGGGLVNVRAAHFEDFVQGIIDRTQWAPPGPLREIRQRTLRIHGHAITDLDAIAENGSRLLLVSCKSVPYTPEYERGDYSAVRNVRTRIEAADVEWGEVIDQLRRDPVGDNYDLSGYEIYGVGCTPFVVFSHQQQTRTVMESGDHVLRATLSAGELYEFLHGPRDD